jgi:phage shock protein PspC (stress-responsive transcriptional regulator)
MATVAPPAADPGAAAPPAEPNDGDPWVLAGVASALARRLGASTQFIRAMLVMAGWFWFWPVIAVYAVAALLVPHAGRRRPGWQNLVGVSRIAVLLVMAAFISASLSFDNSGLFGEGPAVWIPFCGALLAGAIALFTSGRSAAQCGEARCREIVIGWIPAVVLTAAIAIGTLMAPAVRWELVLELGLVALGVALAVTGWRGAGGAGLVPAIILALIAVLLASSGARLQGGVGDTYARPAKLASLRHAYRRAIGDVTLDLRGLRGSRGNVTVAASVGIGNLTIDLPNNAEGTINVSVGAGGLAGVSNVPNTFDSGFDLRQILPVHALGYQKPARVRLHLRLSAAVGRGCVILQVPGESFSSVTGCL